MQIPAKYCCRSNNRTQEISLKNRSLENFVCINFAQYCKMDVVFKKYHKLSILQIAGENILHSHYQVIQRHCNFSHDLYTIIMESRLNNISSVYWIIL